MVIEIFTLFINQAYAIEFDISSPEEVLKNTEFSISIISDETSEKYDVKVYVNQYKKEFSEIFYHDKWQSPFNYLPMVFPDTKDFKIISHVPAETKICTRLRSSSGKSFEKCKPIIVSEKNNNEEPQPEKQENKKSDKIILKKGKTIYKDEKYYSFNLLLTISFLIFIFILLIFILFGKIR